MQIVDQRYRRLLWEWTVGGLPGWLYLPGLMTKWSQKVLVSDVTEVAAKCKPGQLVNLYLEPNLFLSKELSIPVAAKGSLQRVVDLNMRQSLPQNGLHLAWTYGIVRRQGKTLHVMVHLMRESDLKILSDSVSEAGAVLRSIRILGDRGARPVVNNAAKTDRPLRLWWSLTTATALAILITLWLNHKQTLSYLDAEIERLQNVASSVGDEVISLRANQSTSEAVAASVRDEFDVFVLENRRLPLLIDLTNTLENHTWISEFSLFESELRLTGFTGGNVATVMEQLANIPAVSKVTLDGPVSLDRVTQKNRFTLLLVLPIAKN